MPLYAVTHTETKATRLIEAANAAQAARHVVRTSHAIAIPSPAQLIELTKAGVEVETAGASAE